MSGRARVPRDPRLYLEDIGQACDKVMRFMAGVSQEAFESPEHELLHDAVLRNLYIIGEAACHLPEEVTRLAPFVTWGDVRELPMNVREIA